MLAACGSGPVWLGRRGRRIGRSLLCARPFIPVFTSRPCAHFTPAAGGLGGSLTGRLPNGLLQTARPLRCGSLSDRPADETASTGPGGPSVSERDPAGPNDNAVSTNAYIFSPAGALLGPFWCSRFRYATTSYGAATGWMSPQVLVPEPNVRPPCLVAGRREAVAERSRPCATRLPVGPGCRGLLRSLQAAGSPLREVTQTSFGDCSRGGDPEAGRHERST
jgi:hypothetical protein